MSETADLAFKPGDHVGTWKWTGKEWRNTCCCRSRWQDRPDSDGLWWVVDGGDVTIVNVKTEEAFEGGDVQCVYGFHDREDFPIRFDGPWLKADVPPFPGKEPPCST